MLCHLWSHVSYRRRRAPDRLRVILKLVLACTMGLRETVLARPRETVPRYRRSRMVGAVKGPVRVAWHDLEDASGSTPARHSAAAALEGDSAYLFGGSTPGGNLTSETVFALDAIKSRWQQLVPGGSGTTGSDGLDTGGHLRYQPSLTDAAAAVCGDKVYLFGGRETLYTPSDVLLVFDTHTKVFNSFRTHPQPQPVYGHSFIAVPHRYSRDPTHRRLAALGAQAAHSGRGMAGKPGDSTPRRVRQARGMGEHATDAWSNKRGMRSHAKKLPAWMTQGPQGKGWSDPKEWEVASLMSADDAEIGLPNAWLQTDVVSESKMPAKTVGGARRRETCDIFMVGGRRDEMSGQLNDETWVFDTVTRQWRLAPSNTDESTDRRVSGSMRWRHAAAGHRSEIFVYGGDAGLLVPACSDECFIYDTIDGKWSTCPRSGPRPPTCLIGATATALGSIVFVFGGWNGGGVVEHLHAFSMLEYRWLEVAVTTPPEFRPHGRALHAALTLPTARIVAAATAGLYDTGHDSRAAREWQRRLADDIETRSNTLHEVLLLLGGSGFAERSPFYADAWIMQADVKHEHIDLVDKH